VSLAFVTPKEIQKINKAYRGKDAVTDVLSFEENRGAFIGEILICLAQAEKQARVAGWPLKNEIVKLLIHGYLHLMGYDHETLKDANAMEAREIEILKILCSA
jgi:probable rRNA maturation factor